MDSRVNFSNVSSCPHPLALCQKWSFFVIFGHFCKTTLQCKAIGFDFFYALQEKVTDGTTCGKFDKDVCVDGDCLKIGCDRQISSKKELDICGVCDGDASSCVKSEYELSLSPRNLKVGLNLIGVVGRGSRNVVVNVNTLRIPGASVNLVYDGKSDEKLVFEEKSIEIQNVEAKNLRFESFIVQSPLKRELKIILTLNNLSENPRLYKNSVGSISFTEMLPKTQFSPKNLKKTEFSWKTSECSTTCGIGYLSNICVINPDKTRVTTRVHPEFCNNLPIPAENPCENNPPCPGTWLHSNWDRSNCFETENECQVRHHTMYERVRTRQVRCSSGHGKASDILEPCDSISRPESVAACNHVHWFEDDGVCENVGLYKEKPEISHFHWRVMAWRLVNGCECENDSGENHYFDENHNFVEKHDFDGKTVYRIRDKHCFIGNFKVSDFFCERVVGMKTPVEKEFCGEMCERLNLLPEMNTPPELTTMMSLTEAPKHYNDFLKMLDNQILENNTVFVKFFGFSFLFSPFF